MYLVKNYYQTAIENEFIFRNLLRDLRDNRLERPMGDYIPQNLETELEIFDIFEKYSQGERDGKFTITDFQRPIKYLAIIEFQNITTLSSGGARLRYLTKADFSVEYEKLISKIKS